MVSPKPVETSESVPVKKERKKKKFRGETVADRIIASAKRLEQLRLAEEEKAKETVAAAAALTTTAQPDPVTVETVPKAKRKMDLTTPTHEIDDLSLLEWETSSEQSGL